MTAEKKNIKKLIGEVVSDKMDKTRVILIDTKLAHPKYGKIYHKSSKIKAHDEKNAYKAGDMVEICQTRPFSKSKAWEIVKMAAQKGDK